MKNLGHVLIRTFLCQEWKFSFNYKRWFPCNKLLSMVSLGYCSVKTTPKYINIIFYIPHIYGLDGDFFSGFWRLISVHRVTDRSDNPGLAFPPVLGSTGRQLVQDNLSSPLHGVPPFLPPSSTPSAMLWKQTQANLIENESRGIYWVGQKVCSGFSIRGNEKMQMKLLANSIRLLEA